MAIKLYNCALMARRNHSDRLLGEAQGHPDEWISRVALSGRSPRCPHLFPQETREVFEPEVTRQLSKASLRSIIARRNKLKLSGYTYAKYRVNWRAAGGSRFCSLIPITNLIANIDSRFRAYRREPTMHRATAAHPDLSKGLMSWHGWQ